MSTLTTTANIRLLHNYHAVHGHFGSQTLLYTIRQRFWVTSGKRTVNSIIHHCVSCFRMEPLLQFQIMDDLPPERVQFQRPFMHCGVDFCGPVMVRSGIREKSNTKQYIWVFIYVSSLMQIIWKWFPIFQNGSQSLPGHLILEASVKIAKFHLNRILLSYVPTAFELCYKHLFVKWRTLMNFRPISPMSYEPNDLAALTPGHFLISRPLTSFNVPDYSKINSNLLNN